MAVFCLSFYGECYLIVVRTSATQVLICELDSVAHKSPREFVPRGECDLTVKDGTHLRATIAGKVVEGTLGNKDCAHIALGNTMVVSNCRQLKELDGVRDNCSHCAPRSAVPIEIIEPVESVALEEHLGGVLGNLHVLLQLVGANEVGFAGGLVPLCVKGGRVEVVHVLNFHFRFRPPIVQCGLVFWVEDTLLVIKASARSLTPVETRHFIVEIPELLFDRSALPDHVCGMGDFGDHEDPPRFSATLHHHFDDPNGGLFIWGPDGDVFVVKVESHFAHVGCEAHHIDESFVSSKICFQFQELFD